MALRVVLLHALRNKFDTIQGDVSAAFLHADFEPGAEVFVRPLAELGTDRIWKLRKALYGLRRSPQAWQKWFAGRLATLGFSQSRADAGYFWHPAGKVALCIHADDIRMSGPAVALQSCQDQIGKEMRIKVGAAALGSVASLLGDGVAARRWFL